MISNILEMTCISEMLNVIDTDKGGVWHIYTKEVSELQVIITFCKYINGLSCIQAQALIYYDDWEENKDQFEKLAYISEI